VDLFSILTAQANPAAAACVHASPAKRKRRLRALGRYNTQMREKVPVNICGEISACGDMDELVSGWAT
jgi:hypothetical protein